MNPPPTDLIDDLRLLQPPDPFQIILIAGGLFFALIFLWLIWRFIRRRRARPEAVHRREMKAVRKTALQELEGLRPLIEEGRGKEYAVASSWVLRSYLEQRFALRAPRQATEEFLHHAQSSSILGEEQQQTLGEFLRSCDLLKFGRGRAEPEELEVMHRGAVDFVEQTALRRTEEGP